MVSRLHVRRCRLPESESGKTLDPTALFDEMLPVVHAVLVRYYRFIEEDAQAFEDTLRVWFHRMMRRNSFTFMQSDAVQDQIVFVACKYARAFQLARLDERVQGTDLQMLLARPPHDVASEVMIRLRPRYV